MVAVLENPKFVNHKEKLLKNLGAAHVVSDFIYFFGLYNTLSAGRNVGGWEGLPQKESLLVFFGNHDYQVMFLFPQE